MNLALSDEQVFLKEAARGALSRVDTLADARAALDGQRSPQSLWSLAIEAGWPGMLIDERRGGAGLDAFDAMLVLSELGRVLASAPLLGHLAATAILNERTTSAAGEDELLGELATGALRAAYLPASPPRDLAPQWTVDAGAGGFTASLPNARRADSGGALLSGSLRFVPDAPGADLLVGVASLDGDPVGVLVHASDPGVEIEPVMRYDATRAVAHVTLRSAEARLLAVEEQSLRNAWHLSQALLAAESVGAAERALQISIAYAKERHTFGRPIGSYQAIKHALVEVLRQLENGRSLLYYAGWSRHGAPEEFPLAANAARSVAGKALDLAARTMISVHGGIGATWEHDAPLYFRRAQLSRRLLGGTAGATDAVAAEMIVRAAA